MALIDELLRLAPFGVGNRAGFEYRNLQNSSVSGEGARHLKLN